MSTWRVRSDSGLYGYERALHRAGLGPVAGTDEAGRGACAGPLVAAAVILDPRRPLPGLRDSKLLTAKARERCYDQIVTDALAWSVVAIPAAECDALGIHVANLAALRRAVWQLPISPSYVLSDGFPVDGLGAPALAMWKGDQVAACVAAASVIAKVTRDRMMVELAQQWPQYGFDVHKGYTTAGHQQQLNAHGPCPEHRMRYVNVQRAVESAAS